MDVSTLPFHSDIFDGTENVTEGQRCSKLSGSFESFSTEKCNTC